MEKKRQNICNIKDYPYLCTAFKKCNNMVTVVQLVRASDCGSECRGFESLQSPKKKRNFSDDFPLFLLYTPFTGLRVQFEKNFRQSEQEESSVLYSSELCAELLYFCIERFGSSVC